MESRSKWIIASFSVLFGFLAIVFLFGFLLEKEHLSVMVEQRIWNYHLAIKYDETYTTTECTSEMNCTGLGNDRSCRSEMVCRPETKTITHTRCEGTSAGETLPVKAPELPCFPRSGDYFVDTVSYHAYYRISESDEREWSQFGVELWNFLEPGGIVRIERTKWHYITKAEKIKG